LLLPCWTRREPLARRIGGRSAYFYETQKIVTSGGWPTRSTLANEMSRAKGAESLPAGRQAPGGNKLEFMFFRGIIQVGVQFPD